MTCCSGGCHTLLRVKSRSTGMPRLPPGVTGNFYNPSMSTHTVASWEAKIQHKPFKVTIRVAFTVQNHPSCSRHY